MELNKLYGFLHDTYLSAVRRVRYTKAATYKGKGGRIYLLCNHENKSVPRSVPFDFNTSDSHVGDFLQATAYIRTCAQLPMPITFDSRCISVTGFDRPNVIKACKCRHVNSWHFFYARRSVLWRLCVGHLRVRRVP